MFAGLPAALLFMLLDECRKKGIRELYNFGIRRFASRIESRTRRRQLRHLMDFLEDVYVHLHVCSLEAHGLG